MSNTVVISIVSMAGLGFFFATVLSFVNQKLKVEEDPKITKIEAVLPHLNCGACGFASCHQYAEVLAGGKAEPNQCKAASEETVELLCKILNVSVKKKTKEVAIIHCGGDKSKQKPKAIYIGIKTCEAAHNLSGGETACMYGCIGYGDCVKACPFEAIKMENGLPKVDLAKCTACGKCKDACPRNIISIENIESQKFMYVACKNPEKGAEVRKVCSVGCIGCALCQKLTNSIFTVQNNLAGVNYEKINDVKSPDDVIKKCPTKCIKNL